MSEHWAMPVEQALAAFIQTIPAETNPWLAIVAFLAEPLPVMPESAFQQLYALAALLGLQAPRVYADKSAGSLTDLRGPDSCGILAIASLLLRAYKGIFWIFRIRRQPIMICPHITISWTLAIALTAICEQP